MSNSHLHTYLKENSLQFMRVGSFCDLNLQHMLHDLNTDYDLLLLTASANSNRYRTKVKSPFRFGLQAQQTRSHMAALTTTATRHTETQRYTHATEERSDSCLCEAGRDELLRGCRDKGKRAQLRCVFTHAHSQRHAVPRIRQARRRLTAFKIYMKQEILTESPWPPFWLWRQLQWTSAGAASGWDAWGVRVSDARKYI